MKNRFRDFFGKNTQNIILLGLIVLVVSLPLMTDYILYGENVLSTLTRIELVKENLFEHFPVWIQPLTQTEYGKSAAFFQTNVFLIFPAVLRKLGLSILTSYQITMWLVNIVTAVIAFWGFSECTGRQDVGLAGSMLYMWCPYRISDFYISGDMGKSIAWCFLPMLFLGLYRFYTGREHPERLWILPTAVLSLIAAASTHVFLMAAGMSVLWIVFMGKRIWNRKTVAVLLKTAAAVCGLSAWLLIPQAYFMYSFER